MQGHVVFADRLALFAAEVDEQRVKAIACDAARHVTVSIGGRRGVGCATVARALASAGVSVSRGGDIEVRVIAEVVKPEDRSAITESRRPTLVVLNKADLVAAPLALCKHYRTLTGTPTVPMAAHLAVARVDDALMAALGKLAGEPGELGPVDDLAAGPNRQLVEMLDVAGVTVALRALRSGADAAGVQRALRRRSGLDGVVAALTPMVAEVGYQRVHAAVGALEALTATADSELAGYITSFLTAHDTVLACMAAAVAVVEASGMTVDIGDDAEAHLRRAAHWHQFRQGPVDTVARWCGDDIVRGSLRLWRLAQRSGT